MKKIRFALPVLTLVFAITACGDQPTQPTAAPTDANYDGGIGLGSGHRSDTTSTSTTSADPQQQGETGGIGLGSGH